MEQLASDLVIGGGIGAIAKTVMAPVERVKLLMQTQDSNPKVLSGEVKKYSSIVDCVRRVSSEQGIAAFWRGNLVNCLRYAPQQVRVQALLARVADDRCARAGICAGVQRCHQCYVPGLQARVAPLAIVTCDRLPRLPRSSKTDPWKSLGSKLFSGGLAGAVANTICYPFDFARTRLGTPVTRRFVCGADAVRCVASDVGGGKQQFKGITDCIMQTVRAQGMTGLYTGCVLCAGVCELVVIAHRA
jgi:solute carrier family 25 (adenine nucleotide translocator) protein 4/5/6/31